MIYLGNIQIGNGNYLGALNIPDSNIFMSQSVAAEPVSGIQRLAVSSSLYAYYDIAFTQSYSQSGQTTVFDLSGNGKNGSTVGTINYNTAGISGSVLRLGASGQGNRVEMPSVNLSTSGQYTFVMSWYMTSANYPFGFTEFFAGREPEAYGMFAGNNTYSGAVLLVNNDEYAPSLYSGTGVNSAQSGSWHISQFSFNDSTNTWNFCMDGFTGSYVQASTISTGIITPKWNYNSQISGRYLNSGSMMQVMALYTGSLTTQELLDNHNSLKGRYGLA